METLREQRDQIGMTQQECATALGVTPETWRNWESGRRHMSEPAVRLWNILRANKLKERDET